jgi:23S rRNA G2445 N2-methylase RlmL
MSTSYQHFLSIQPGLEELLLKELNWRFQQFEQTQIKQIKKEKGGVSLECPLGTSLYFLENLKTPTKITIEILQFKTTDFPKLYNKLLKFNWSKVLRYPEFKLSATCTKSRLIHSDRVIETAKKAIKKYYEQNPPSSKQKEKLPEGFHYPLQLRILEDICTVSIDISRRADGEEFFKKNIKVKNAKASLRENLAFAMLLTNEYCHLENLIDPMAGAGTIPLVAKDNRNTLEHVYHYLKIPIDRLKKLDIPTLKSPTKTIVNDIDETHYKFLVENSKEDQSFEVMNIDFSEIKLTESYAIFSNLPYGKRVKIDKNQFLKKLFEWTNKQQELINFQCFLAPIEWQEQFKKQNFKTSYIFENGGIKVGIFTKTK